NVGSRLPGYCTSKAPILLAARDDDALHAYCGGVEMQAKTSRTQYTPETLLPCLVEIRRHGWCIVDQELVVGLRTLAVPVRD
ncbi:IclR family transcriptional regulator domain-containing protein, partial [Pseudomonas aeruginosa]|uniref:IclR family transcriptional regulator domain-containing protein n=1 Tax=Pseudomonas aeruginosa TaxID=287 RepID=UPI003CC6A4E7